MQFDMRQLPRASRYKILGSSVTPRPIAWVTSRSAAGVVNAAPYSFFNVMGDDPPTVALGLLAPEGGGYKDTAANIIATGEFVVNLVAEADAAVMNLTCMTAPPDFSEIENFEIPTSPSVAVAPPRIASAPVSFECKTLTVVNTGPRQVAVIGEVLIAHVADAYVLDAEHLYLDTLGMGLIARMHGAGWYARSTDLFQMDRPLYEAWLGNQVDSRSPGEQPS